MPITVNDAIVTNGPLSLSLQSGTYLLSDAGSKTSVDLIRGRSDWSPSRTQEIVGIREDAGSYIVLLKQGDGNSARYLEQSFDSGSGRTEGRLSLVRDNVLSIEAAYGVDLNSDGVVGLPEGEVVFSNGSLRLIEKAGQYSIDLDSVDDNGVDINLTVGRGQLWVLPEGATVVGLRADIGNDNDDFRMVLSYGDEPEARYEEIEIVNGRVMTRTNELDSHSLRIAEVVYGADLNSDGDIGDVVASRLDDSASTDISSNRRYENADNGGMTLVKMASGAIVISGGIASEGTPFSELSDPITLSERGGLWAPEAGLPIAVKATEDGFTVLFEEGKGWREQDFDSVGNATGRDRDVSAKMLVQLETSYDQDFDENGYVGDVIAERFDSSLRSDGSGPSLYRGASDAFYLFNGETDLKEPGTILARTVSALTAVFEADPDMAQEFSTAFQGIEAITGDIFGEAQNSAEALAFAVVTIVLSVDPTQPISVLEDELREALAARLDVQSAALVLATARKDVADAQSELARLQSDVSDATIYRNAAGTVRDAAEKSAASALKALEALQADRVSAGEEEARLTGELEAVLNQLVALNQQAAQVQSEIISRTEALNEAILAVTSANASLTEIAENIALETTLLNQAQGSLPDAQDAAQSANAALQGAQNALSDAQAVASAISDEIIAIGASLATLEGQAAPLEAQVQTAQSAVSEAEAEIARLETLLVQVEAGDVDGDPVDIATSIAIYTEIRDTAGANLPVDQAALDVINGQIAIVETQLQTAQQDYSNAMQTVASNSENVANLGAQAEAANAQVVAVQATIASQQEALLNLAAIQTGAQTQLTNAQAAVAEHQAALATLNGSLPNILSEIVEAEAYRDFIGVYLQDVQNAIVGLESSLTTAVAQAEALQAQLESAQEALAEAENTLASLNAGIAQATLDIERAEAFETAAESALQIAQEAVANFNDVPDLTNAQIDAFGHALSSEFRQISVGEGSFYDVAREDMTSEELQTLDGQNEMSIFSLIVDEMDVRNFDGVEYIETEDAGNTFATATSLDLGTSTVYGSITGDTEETGDDLNGTDMYMFTVEHATTVTISMTSNDLDSMLFIFNEAGQMIGRNDDYNGANSQISLEFEPGDYFVAASSFWSAPFLSDVAWQFERPIYPESDYGPNAPWEPSVQFTGWGNGSDSDDDEGDYVLRFTETPSHATLLTDAQGTEPWGPGFGDGASVVGARALGNGDNAVLIERVTGVDAIWLEQAFSQDGSSTGRLNRLDIEQAEALYVTDLNDDNLIDLSIIDFETDFATPLEGLALTGETVRMTSGQLQDLEDGQGVSGYGTIFLADVESTILIGVDASVINPDPGIIFG